MPQSDWSGIQIGLLWAEEHFFRQKVVVDCLLDERMIPGKFGCICLNGVEMHKEHTYIQTFFFIYIDNEEQQKLIKNIDIAQGKHASDAEDEQLKEK